MLSLKSKLTKAHVESPNKQWSWNGCILKQREIDSAVADALKVIFGSEKSVCGEFLVKMCEKFDHILEPVLTQLYLKFSTGVTNGRL